MHDLIFFFYKLNLMKCFWENIKMHLININPLQLNIKFGATSCLQQLLN